MNTSWDKDGAMEATDFLQKKLGVSPTTFGSIVVAIRGLLDLSQAQLARQLKVSRSRICDIEKGRALVSIKMAAKIARMAKFPENLAVKYAIQDQLRKAKLKLKVEVKAA